ncbi:MAG TPA: nickel insertion protein, partial [Candidatus Limnocylindrales bacterium]|nr:nickel insertion protein [Candidatus Limnocylindrales bacterium]
SLGTSAIGLKQEEMLVIETNIDDMNPQFFDHVMECLFGAGARDVFLTPIQMKKNRPAILLTVICEPGHRDLLAKIILQETTSIGARYYPISRLILIRETRKVKTRYGEVAVKIALQPNGGERAAPEYEDLKRIARAQQLPLKVLHDEVMRNLKK